jgi:hypothetical protein
LGNRYGFGTFSNPIQTHLFVFQNTEHCFCDCQFEHTAREHDIAKWKTTAATTTRFPNQLAQTATENIASLKTHGVSDTAEL